MKPIYLDYNATTPIDPAVIEAMQPFIHQIFGNPSSSHIFGTEARKAVENARQLVARLLECHIEEVIFTSGGSESNNHAIKGIAYANRDRGNHIITSQIEHPAVTEVCHFLEKQGFQITWLPVDEYGLVDPEAVEAAITPATILVTIMHANNEVGTIQPIGEIARIARQHGVLIHTDAAQSIGKIPASVKDLDVDALSMAGHKLYAPKGIGALYVRSGLKIEKFIHGADHEMNKRAGTENVLEIVGLGKACELVSNHLAEYSKIMKLTRDQLEDYLEKSFPEIRVNGHPEKRLANTLSLSFPGLEANTILAELETVAASAGAACHSDQIDVSHVLEAMGVPIEYAMGTIRFSTGRFTSRQDIEKAAEEIESVVRRLRPESPKQRIVVQTGTVKLTRYTHGLGCACKLRPQLLEEILKKIPAPLDSHILVGPQTSDDASVYQIDENTAIVQTVDFFTPVVDDPYQFGAIAAANSLSDIYAMGAQPLFALNIVGFPSNRLPLTVLQEILSGALDKATEAGISIIGGHTVDDTEPKFGLAVTGLLHPQKIFRNNTVKVGDKLILTKPLGTGILSTALKRGLLNDNSSHLLIKTMATLNKTAAEAMKQFPVNACTDITGFGLMGHLLEMVKDSSLSARIYQREINFLPDVASLAAAGVIPGGSRDNFDFCSPHVRYPDNMPENRKLMLNDAQTSGGLLISVSELSAEELLSRLHDDGIGDAALIGEIVERGDAVIEIV